jgi:hypothetical protein
VGRRLLGDGDGTAAMEEQQKMGRVEGRRNFFQQGVNPNPYHMEGTKEEGFKQA